MSAGLRVASRQWKRVVVTRYSAMHDVSTGAEEIAVALIVFLQGAALAIALAIWVWRCLPEWRYHAAYRAAMRRRPGDHLKDGRCHICRRHVWGFSLRWAAWWRGEKLPQPLYSGTRLIICKNCEGEG